MKYILFTLLILFCLRANATVVILIRQGNKLIVGADSRRTIVYPYPKKDTYDDKWCKIRQAGKFYYTFGGANDQLQAFHANGTAQRARTVNEFAEQFGASLAASYNKYLEKLKKDNPAGLSAQYINSNTFAEVAIFAPENGGINLCIVRFGNLSGAAGRPNVRYSIEKDSPGAILGYKKELLGMPAAERSRIERYQWTNPVLFMEKMIRYEQKFYPTIIGGPVDVLQMTPLSTNWLQQKPCSNPFNG